MRKSESTSSSSIYDALRRDIMLGDFEPGCKLKPDILRTRYGCAVSTMREVLVRLAAEDFVRFEDQRGFRVRGISPDDLRDLTRTRVLIEQGGARLSIENGGIGWEAQLAAAHHKLAHVEARMRVDPGSNFNMWRQCDWEFHETLLSACNSRILRDIHRNLFDRFRLVVHAETGTYGFRGKEIVDEHAAILKAALARDVGACARAVEDHISVYYLRSLRDAAQ